MNQFQRISKNEAKKLFAEGKVIYLLQCNVRLGNMWSYPCEISGKEYLQNYRVCYPSMIGDSTNQGWLYPRDSFSSWDEYYQEYICNQNNKYPYTSEEIESSWNRMYNNWQYYNSNYQLGYYPHYYIMTK